MRNKRWIKAFALLFAVSLIAAACGDSDDGGGGDVAATDAPTTTLGEGQTGTTSFASTTVAPSSGDSTTTTEEEPMAEPTAHLLRPGNVPADDQRGGTVVLGYQGVINHANGAVSSGYAVNTAGSRVAVPQNDCSSKVPLAPPRRVEDLDRPCRHQGVGDRVLEEER